MSFFEYWKAKQAAEAAARQPVIEQSQSWVGRRVWCNMAPPPKGLGARRPGSGKLVYGEVVRIDEGGTVYVVVGYDQQDRPRYFTCRVESLGDLVTLAQE